MKNNDKVLFWISGALTSFCVSYYLQKKIDSDFFAIIDSYDKPKSFFKNQSLVKFQETWFYHDHFENLSNPDIEYLSNFEKKYDINLWELAINERIFYRFNNVYKFSDDEILSVLEHECKLFENILTKINPDFLIMSEPTLHQQDLLYKMCKKIGVKTLLRTSLNTTRCAISENPRKLDLDIDLNTVQSSNRSFDDLLTYRKSINSFDKIKDYRGNFKVSNVELLKSSLKFLSSENQHIKTHYTHRGRTKLDVLKDESRKKLARKRRYSFMENNLETEIEHNEKFVYFPLAVDEERNLLIAAPYYTNQLEIIRDVVKALPVGYKLYIKENPNMWIRYWRDVDEYKEIMDIPNVRLYHPDVSAESLFQKCSLVITIGGSSGLDAAFYQKPSIVFTDLGYTALPSVSLVDNITDLPRIIRESLQKEVSNDDLDKYLKIVHDNSFDFDNLGFEKNYNSFFYHDGHYLSVEIQESKMSQFLKENQVVLERLSSEYEKKITAHKK